MSTHVRIVPHSELSTDDLDGLRRLFDAEYSRGHGPWNADAPYGYAPADVHTLVFDEAAVVAHVGFQIRAISVGPALVTVAGTGGVLVSHEGRGSGLGRVAMAAAQDAMRGNRTIEFGYLGCRQEVVPFYRSVGWYRIRAAETYVSRISQKTVVADPGAPIMICAGRRSVKDWPSGDIDLHGLPW